MVKLILIFTFYTITEIFVLIMLFSMGGYIPAIIFIVILSIIISLKITERIEDEKRKLKL